MKIQQEMQALIEQLNQASLAYYQEDREIMSNWAYDNLYDRLVEMEKEAGFVLAGSPTQKVGHEVVGSLSKVKHESKMLSLDKTKDIAVLVDFLDGQTGLLSWKLDGLTIVLTYLEGELYQAVTRGNGEIGEDITHNARFFSNIPLQVPYKGRLVLRGEAVISYTDFEQINSRLAGEEKYKNPRNLCSGTVRQLNSKIAAERNVKYIVFSVVEGKEWQKKEEQLQWVQSLGFECVETKKVTAENVEAQVHWFEKRVQLYPFASDGLVLTFDDIGYSKSLGETAKFPRDSIAFKWEDELRETTLREIQWNTSRTGLINPVAVFEPVELEGTTVERASLHNVSILENLALGLGDTIVVYKANMIIPQVADNLTRSSTAEIPAMCPECGFETEIIQQKEGKALYCTNPNCHARLIQSLTHYVSRNAMNIEGLSEATLEKMVEKRYMQNYPDIYTLNQYQEEIKQMDGFGEKSWHNLWASIEKSKHTQLYRFIYALGINHVGLSNAKLLCKYFHNDWQAVKNANEEELNSIEGFGEVIAHSIVKYFSAEENLRLIQQAMQYLIWEEEQEPEEKGLLGLTFVITGELSHFPNRDALKQYIEVRGGKVTGSVTGKTNYLINNDVNSGSSKNKKAKELGIPILDETAFLNQFAQ